VSDGVLAFQADVNRWVSALAADDSVHSFDDLVSRLPGVYPTEARDALERLVAAGGLSVADVRRLRQRSHSVRGGLGSVRGLPVPHPLDYDWRFSASAAKHLAAQCERLSGGKPIALLGAPTVLAALRGRGRVPAVLLDANPAIVEAFARAGRYQALQCDFRQDALPRLVSSVVLLDPPWYGEHELLFLWAAAQLCAPGATALVSLPAEGTRPGVVDETARALRTARRWGLHVETHDRGALGYLSPPFERNALDAAGLTGLPDEWRRGDLVALRASGAPVRDPAPETTTTRWPEVAIGPVRIRLRASGPTPFGRIRPQLTQVVKGDVLDTVSRRDPRRGSVDVWTSGNRVFGCQSLGPLRCILQAVADGDPPDDVLMTALGRSPTGSERSNIRTAVDQICTLVSTEMEELAAMGWAA
jgi:hypothetical protein